MLIFLFTIVLGGMNYNVVSSCKDLGGTYFPKDDSKQVRVLSICSQYGPDQTRQVVEHELLHICMHQHIHRFVTQQQLDSHLHVQYSEEAFADLVSPCLIEDQEKLFAALRDHHVAIR